MKPPVPLNSAVVPLFCALACLALLLWVVDPAGRYDPTVAEKAEPLAGAATPDAGWHERDYLLHYAEAVCLRAAYDASGSAATPELKALEAEAWAMVELTRQSPEVYNSIHRRATEAGHAQSPARALAGCRAWVGAEAGFLLRGTEPAG